MPALAAAVHCFPWNPDPSPDTSWWHGQAKHCSVCGSPQGISCLWRSVKRGGVRSPTPETRGTDSPCVVGSEEKVAWAPSGTSPRSLMGLPRTRPFLLASQTLQSCPDLVGTH